MRFFILALALIFSFSLFAKQLTDEELYEKAQKLEKEVVDLDGKVKKMNLEVALMNDVVSNRPSRIPAAEIPAGDKGKPIIDIDKFKESMKKLSKTDLKNKIKEKENDAAERGKTLARLKREREEIFRQIKFRVRGMKQ